MSIYFNEEEMKCHCCGALPEGGIDPKLYELLDMIRVAVQTPIYINSAYRCPSHNENVGGVPNSEHVQGVATDISTNGIISIADMKQVVENCMDEMGIEGGIGTYPSQDFLHVDVRGYSARWDESDY